MNTQNFAALGLAAALSFGSLATVSLVQAPVRAEKTADVQASGTFIGSAPKNVTGQAQIVTKDGKRYLVLDQTFQSDNGPDLFVLLHNEAKPSSYRNNFHNLGRLQKVSGTQWYEISAEVDLSEAKSVVVWCRQFNVTFGYATLGS
jgi:hypothetical protein